MLVKDSKNKKLEHLKEMGFWIFKQTYRDIVRLSNDEKILLSNRGRDYKH